MPYFRMTLFQRLRPRWLSVIYSSRSRSLMASSAGCVPALGKGLSALIPDAPIGYRAPPGGPSADPSASPGAPQAARGGSSGGAMLFGVILVVIGADEGGRKELVGLTDGYRESEQSWRELLVDLRHRGLEIGPELAIGDGNLGFWKALRQVYGAVREQRCWVHSVPRGHTRCQEGGYVQ